MYSIVKRNSDDNARNPFLVFVHDFNTVDGEVGFDDWANNDLKNRHGNYILGKFFKARDSVTGSNKISLPTRANAAQTNVVQTVPKSNSSVAETVATMTVTKPTTAGTATVTKATTIIPVTTQATTTVPIIASGINVLQQDNKFQGPASASKGSSHSLGVPQINSLDEYNPIFEYRALKRKEGEEWILHKDSVQKFKAHPPPGPNSGPNALPSRPSSVLWPGFNG